MDSAENSQNEALGRHVPRPRPSVDEVFAPLLQEVQKCQGVVAQQPKVKEKPKLESQLAQMEDTLGSLKQHLENMLVDTESKQANATKVGDVCSKYAASLASACASLPSIQSEDKTVRAQGVVSFMGSMASGVAACGVGGAVPFLRPLCQVAGALIGQLINTSVPSIREVLREELRAMEQRLSTFISKELKEQLRQALEEQYRWALQGKYRAACDEISEEHKSLEDCTCKHAR